MFVNPDMTEQTDRSDNDIAHNISSEENFKQTMNQFRNNKSRKDDLGKLLRILTDPGSSDEGARARRQASEKKRNAKYLPQVIERD